MDYANANKESYFSIDDIDNIAVEVEKVRGNKCSRCWKYKNKLSSVEICERCEESISN